MFKIRLSPHCWTDPPIDRKALIAYDVASAGLKPNQPHVPTCLAGAIHL